MFVEKLTEKEIEKFIYDRFSSFVKIRTEDEKFEDEEEFVCVKILFDRYGPNPEYKFTDFDITSVNTSAKRYEKGIKKDYINFMSKKFPKYEKEYNKNLLKQQEEKIQ